MTKDRLQKALPSVAVMAALVTVWWVDPEEWDELVAESGLEVEARYGWFDRRAFDETSREAVYVARKPS